MGWTYSARRRGPLVGEGPQTVYLGAARTGIMHARALVAQGIEQRFPKPCVAGSNPAGGTLMISQNGF